MPPGLATVRFKSATNIPGARSPTLRPYCFCHALNEVAVSLDVSRLRLWAAGLALHQGDVLDAMIQSVFHDRVIPVDACRELVVFPDEIALVAFRWLLQHKAQAGIVAFVFDAGKSSSPALEAYAAGFSQANPIEGIVGAAGKGLGQHGIQVVGDPGLPGCFGIRVQGVFAEAVLLPQRSKGPSPLLLVGASAPTPPFPALISPHTSQSAL